MTVTTALTDPTLRETTLLRMCGALLSAAPLTGRARTLLNDILGTDDQSLDAALKQVQAHSSALARHPNLDVVEPAGHLHVDGGCLIIGTPGGAHRAADGQWTLNPALNDMDDHGVAVDGQHEAHWVKTGLGDGVYPLYIRRSEDGNVAELRVVFLPLDVAAHPRGIGTPPRKAD
ncbi:hypothetical protein [Deinococcus soli (ex Cha et al. 2016)]|uniref:Uncharacterized protein n=2 Tax=Deinococcus soli (ex Cha et al. 2016) TaxID=1309411 RepID=A0ACC6KFL4_9DEIO|nr:hypothetical protein [Deinococcus soli (ex Cha et al. 2016)]MDR6218359.1 hypothetical protein [Deinococcus soli (ex Cha et al. 2016)]MDR6329099.1 hypothetical protein [Deinococcus soli (ex Cha et al. 2016)]MDR6751372.1 hypothetical protein [Deinococcus soli (ex Cha et al. 2016)]